MNWNDYKKAYLIGIKGSGMTALAEALVLRGVAVSGSDTQEKFFTDEVLAKRGIAVKEGFDAGNIPSDADIIVRSTAYTEENNAEVAEAKRHQRAMISYPEAAGALMQEKLGLSVCGTHGKTTTSALLAEVLREAGEDPTAIVGSRINQWGGNALVGKGQYFVLEADEYQNKLRYYDPFGMILTSVDWDHPDFFPDFESYKAVFAEAVRKLPHRGVVVSWGDSVVVEEVAKEARCHHISYGFLEGNDIRVLRYAPMSPEKSQEINKASGVLVRQTFEVAYKGESLGAFALQLAGRHNALNAAAVIGLCRFLGIDMEKVREGLARFAGTSRRFEYIGTRNKALLFDDYAHHPEEVKATLKAFRELYPEKHLVAVFHPHTFTRTKALLSDFAQSFDEVDRVYVLDIYGSAREEQGGVSSLELVNLINTYQRGKASNIAGIDEAIEELRDSIGDNDVVIALGAGNVWEVVHKLKGGE